jgi:spermidine/putrescine transport system substrate-binding protein
VSVHSDGPGGLNRREFLRRAGIAGIALPSAAAILAACQNSSQTTSASGGAASANPYGTGGVSGAAYPLPRSDAPVTWNIPADNQPIASGLPPETGATLKIFNWGYYLKPSIMKEFGQKHGCKVELTTYHDLPGAFEKIRSGQVDFDLQFGMGTDWVGKYVAGKYLRPLNKDYLTNFQANVWDQFKNPFYDSGARYTVPYGLSTTGIFWRNDYVKADITGMDNPYDIFWTGAPKNKTHLLGDARDVLSMAMMRKGITDINTGDPAIIQQAHDDLLEIVKAVNPKWDNDDYTEVPQGQAWLHQTWSGNAIDAFVFYMQPGQSPEIFSFVWPPAVHPSIPGVVSTDLIGILSAGKNPVLAHMFLDQMYDPATALENFSTYTGYQPPNKTIVPDKLVAQGIVPPNLASAITKETDFAKGLQLFELAPEVDALWQNAFQQLKAGV